MPNMNDCKICGNLVRDPEIKNIKKAQETGSGNFEQFGTAQSELPPQNDDLPF